MASTSIEYPDIVTALEDIVTALEAERDRALTLVQACDDALAVFRDGGQLASIPQRNRVRPPLTPRTPKQTPTPTREAPVAAKTAPARPVTAPPASKMGRYSVEIMKMLSHYSLAPHYSADTTVIRRSVAKACWIDEKKDTSFRGDMTNAQGKLKRDKQVDRSGNVWALVHKPA